MRRASWTVAVTLVLLIGLPAAWAQADAGDLDTSYGGGRGWVVGPFGVYTDSIALGQAITPAGKLVLVGGAPGIFGGQYQIAQYTASGALDPSFGGGVGDVTIGMPTRIGASTIASSVALQQDGSIVVNGTAEADPSSGALGFGVARLQPNGAIDSTFGNNGIALVPVGTVDTEGQAVAVDPSGRIVLAGGTQGSFTVARLLSNGTLDTSFSSDGLVTTPITGASEGATAVAMLANGDIAVAGPTTAGVTVAEYTSKGALDPSFSGNGIAPAKYPGGGLTNTVGMAVQSNGMLVTAGGQGGSPQAFALARFTTSGSLDPSFGGDGIVTTAFGGGAEAEDVVVDSGGLIVAAGAAGNGLGLARYQPSGTLDASFGNAGTVAQKIGYTGQQSFALSIGLDPKGRYVVGASATPVADSQYQFAAARFLSS